MRRASVLLMTALISVLIYGCTHNVSVPLRPSYQTSLVQGNSLAKVKPPLQFTKGKFTDKRLDTTVLSSFKQQVHTYNLRAERPVDEALFEGLSTMLKNSGHNWSETDPKNVRIDMQLLNIQASRNAGFVEVTASSRLQVKLDFVNAATGDPIYSEVYTGKDDRGRALLGLMDMVIESIDASIVDLVNKVGNDEQLATTLRKINR